jgi:hypothetical protein
MECEINAHPLGHEVRLNERASLLSGQVHATLELAEADADDLKRLFMARGWTGLPPMPW